MDDAAARDMAALAAALTAAACGVPLPAGGGGSGSSEPLPLPLAAADVTACCGGTTMALARAFARVTAVELDAERAADLAHNLGVAGISTTTLREADLPVAWAARGAGVGAGGGSDASARVGVLCGDAVALLARLGHHACAVVDPPWGGPAFLEAWARDSGGGGGDADAGRQAEAGANSSGSGSEDEDSGADGAGEGKSAASANPGGGGSGVDKRRAAPRPRVADVPFGGQPLSAFCARLWRHRVARVAVLRMPSRGFDFEAFAMAVAARCRDGGGGGGGAGGDGDGGAAEAAPLFLSCDLGRSRLLLIVFGGALAALPPDAPGGEDRQRRQRKRWQLCAAARSAPAAAAAATTTTGGEAQGEQQRGRSSGPWRLPEPCSVFVPGEGRFAACEREIFVAD